MHTHVTQENDELICHPPKYGLLPKHTYHEMMQPMTNHQDDATMMSEIDRDNLRLAECTALHEEHGVHQRITM